jgi:hypothetical protein
MLSAPVTAQPKGPTQAELSAAAANAADWLHPNHDYSGAGSWTSPKSTERTSTV